eukprot:223990-Prorocentrum_minimum.AAC.1
MIRGRVRRHGRRAFIKPLHPWRSRFSPQSFGNVGPQSVTDGREAARVRCHGTDAFYRKKDTKTKGV